ncbi:Trimeric GatFAB AmidoTransferase(AdT) complex subunit [Elasticomyces elasticus]|nr:Trimeric GatFAB AmidoTransferase(AdT) complex subunit [Elasticomyces elasticus]
MSSESNGPLFGKLIAIKDNISTGPSTPSLATTAASNTLRKHASPFAATVVRLLTENGALIAGKTNCDEFGMGSHSLNSAYGPVKNAYVRGGHALSAGGSSGGSAVAVATRQCWAALGTDTGGSVRLPAAYCGIVGFKPSYGLLSRWGVLDYANSMDTVGILSRDVPDARTLFRILNRFDEEDPTSLPPSVRARLSSADAGEKPDESARNARALRIGVPTDYCLEELSSPVHRAWIRTLNRLQDQGHQLVPVNLPSTKQALSAYYVLAPAEASSNLAKYDGVRYGSRLQDPPSHQEAEADKSGKSVLFSRYRGEGFGDEVKRRILLGAFALSAAAMDNYFIQAQKIRRLVQDDFDRVFASPNPLHTASSSSSSPKPSSAQKPAHEASPPQSTRSKVDLLITPTAPTLPPTIDDVRQQDPLATYTNDAFTVPASLAGLPSISVPVQTAGRPRSGAAADGDGGWGDVGCAGVQVIGQFGDDDIVLRMGEIVEGLR